MTTSPELHFERDGHVAHLRWSRPPNNFLDPDFMEALANQLDAFDQDTECRAVVLSAEGKVFSAGADFQQAEAHAARVTSQTNVLDPSAQRFQGGAFVTLDFSADKEAGR